MPKAFDVAVIGAGVFGAWSAHQLCRAGANVVLVDAYGPANSRASSGGESRIIRRGYGSDAIYSASAHRALALWQQLFEEIRQPQLFQRTGVLWLARDQDPYCLATLETLRRSHIKHERLDRNEILERFPLLDPGPVTWGILEPSSGVLMARQAVQAVVASARLARVSYLQDAVVSDGGFLKSGSTGRDVDCITTQSGQKIFAGNFVFACGPWLPGLFPALLGNLIHVTRQEVFFFGTPADADSQRLPAWIDFSDLVYGIPNLDNRGFKLAIDEHGPQFDPDTGDRMVSPSSLEKVRKYLAQRMPSLASAPLTETRVCQYENTSNGDFLIDRHPEFENVWLVGGGSGHGFKHGPVVGEYVAGLLSGDTQVEPRFTLATKEQVHKRRVY